MMKRASLFLFIIIGFSLMAQDNLQKDNENLPTKEEKKPKTVVITYDPENREISEFIPLKSIPYATVEGFCKPMLSKTGTMGYMRERNSVVVHDFKKNVDKIKEFIEKIDRPAVNIRIDVDFMNTGSSAGGGINVDVDYGVNGPGQIVMKNGKILTPNNITFSANKLSGKTIRNNSQFIVTQSGHPATLFVGKTILDPSWLRNYRLAPTIIMGGGGTVIIPGQQPEFVWRNVGASLQVLPRYLDNGMIEVEFYPEVSYIDGEGQNRAVKVESISTKLTVQDGQRVSIGGVISSNRNFYKRLFGPQFRDRDDSINVLDMYMTATVLRSRRTAPQQENKTDIHDIPCEENPYKWR